MFSTFQWQKVGSAYVNPREDVSSCKVQIQSLIMDNKAVAHMDNKVIDHMDTDMDSSPVEMEAFQLSAVSPEDLLVRLDKMLIAPFQW